jgi:hypothetical protein
MLHATCYMLHATCYMLHATCYMLHATFPVQLEASFCFKLCESRPLEEPRIIIFDTKSDISTKRNERELDLNGLPLDSCCHNATRIRKEERMRKIKKAIFLSNISALFVAPVFCVASLLALRCSASSAESFSALGQYLDNKCAGSGLVVPYSSHKREIAGSIPGWAH